MARRSDEVDLVLGRRFLGTLGFMSKIPLLCYHNVGPSPGDSRFKLLYVSQPQFERQLWTIRRLGLRGVSMGAGMRHFGGRGRGKPVVLTFDDGYVDTVTQALPLLQQYG